MTISDEKYVSLTTYRRSGEAVPVAVWIAPISGGRAGFTTGNDVGKVKRIRNNGAVTVRPCDMRGKVAPDAPEVHAVATVHTDSPEADEIRAAIDRKYGIQAKALTLGSKIGSIFGRDATNTTILLTFDD